VRAAAAAAIRISAHRVTPLTVTARVTVPGLSAVSVPVAGSKTAA